MLSRVMKNGGITDMVLRFQFLFITYVFLYIVYVVWNRMIIACEGVAFDRRRKVISVTEWREHQIFIGGALFCGLLALESLDLQVSPMTMSWIWALALWFYQGMAVVILFRSQKLTGMLKNAMEAMYK